MDIFKGIRVVVFDFDGTLVRSNEIKYDAYFKLFPEDVKVSRIISTILDKSYEKSRFIILEEIVSALTRQIENMEILTDVGSLAEQYNNIVVEGAKSCPQVDGAEDLLTNLKTLVPLYLSSLTPQNPLQEIVSHRQWTHYFKRIFGYPHRKEETLKTILQIEKIAASELLVFGDGVNDQVSAKFVGCRFCHVFPENGLRNYLNCFHN